MEDDPKYDRDPTVETTVFKHPDLPPVLEEPLSRENAVEPTFTPPRPVEQPAPVQPPPVTAKIKPPMPVRQNACRAPECPIFVPELPSPVLDVRDLATTLLATFAMGAAVALALTYFSRPKVSIDA